MSRAVFAILLVASVLAQPTCAQTTLNGSGIPSRRMLDRFGLERAWWSQATLNPTRDRVRHVVVDEDNVYVQATSGVVTCFKAETGRRLWVTQLGGRDNVSYPATSNEDLILVAAGMHVFAVDKHTGALEWELNIGRQPSTAPVIDNDNFYIGTLDGAVLSFKLQESNDLYNEGKLPEFSFQTKAWHYQTARRITTAPVTNGRVVAFASMDKSLYSVAAIGETAGTTNFQFQTDEFVSAALTLSEDPTSDSYGAGDVKTYYVFMAAEDGRLYCISMNKGVMLWDFQAGRPIRHRPQVIGPDVFVTPQLQGLFCIASASGVQRWWVPEVNQFIAATRSRVFGSDASGNIVVLDRASGIRIGSLPLRGYSIRVGNDRSDRIFISTPKGRVVCIREAGSTVPEFHRFPERQPILPDLAADPDDAAAAGDAN